MLPRELARSGLCCRASVCTLVCGNLSLVRAFLDNLIDQVSTCAHVHDRFDMNDSQVRPIHESLIQSQFGGKESAYMLFYARKSFIAQQVSTVPSVPPFWQAEIATMNEQLEQAS